MVRFFLKGHKLEIHWSDTHTHTHTHTHIHTQHSTERDNFYKLIPSSVIVERVCLIANNFMYPFIGIPVFSSRQDTTADPDI
jgi:hypothetical protein